MREEITKIWLIFIIMFLPNSSIANQKDSEIFLFLNAIINPADVLVDTIYECKEFMKYQLNCGDGSGGATVNYYVFFIGQHEQARFLNLSPSSGSGTINSRCGGTVTIEKISKEELPPQMQNSDNDPKGKKNGRV